MTATSHSRGHEIVYETGQWRWSDTRLPLDDKRPCIRCGLPPTPEGYDACIGYVPGKTSVCCGHGVHEPHEM